MKKQNAGKKAMSLWFLLVAILWNCDVHAQEQTHLEDLTLEELLNVKVVSATRSESTAIRLPAMVTVITGEEIAAWGVPNLAEGLRQASGVNVRRNPGDFPQYEVSIRGNTADFLNSRTLFLIDGIPVRNSSGGLDPSWLPLGMVKQIEIVKGPASALYGANAFGGVINIITKIGTAEKENQVKLGGSVRKDAVSGKGIPGVSAGLAVGNQKESWNYFVSADMERENDSSVNYSGQTYQDVFGKASYQVTERTNVSLTGLVSVDQNQLGSNNSPDPIGHNISHVAGVMKTQLSEQSSLQVAGYLNYFNHHLDYSNSLSHYENRSQTVGMTSQYSTVWGQNHAIVIGVEGLQDSGSLDTKETNWMTSAIQGVGWETKYQNAYGFFIQDEYKGWSGWSPLLGLRYDDNSTFGSALSPRAAIGYAVREDLNLFVSIGTGFRAPNFNESYIRGYGKIGNEDLRPELTTTYELGVKSVNEYTQNSLVLFKQDVSKKIELRKVDGSSLNTYDNTGTASIYGLELEGSGKPRSDLKVFYNTTLLSSYDGSGQRIVKVVDQMATLGANFAVKTWNLRPIVFYQGNQKILDTMTGETIMLPGYATANLQAVRKWESSALTLYLKNLTDQKYREGYSPFILKDAAWLPGVTLGANWSQQF